MIRNGVITLLVASLFLSQSFVLFNQILHCGHVGNVHECKAKAMDAAIRTCSCRKAND
jgi:hypothetical protein